MHKIFDPPISPEALQRMSFEEKYEGFCVDLVKVNFICSFLLIFNALIFISFNTVTLNKM